MHFLEPCVSMLLETLCFMLLGTLCFTLPGTLFGPQQCQPDGECGAPRGTCCTSLCQERQGRLAHRFV